MSHPADTLSAGFCTEGSCPASGNQGRYHKFHRLAHIQALSGAPSGTTRRSPQCHPETAAPRLVADQIGCLPTGAHRGEAVCAEPGLGALRGQCQGVIEVQIEVQLFLSQPQTKKGSRSREPFFQNLSIPICLKMVYFFNRPLLDLRVTCQIEPKSFEIWRGQRDSNSQPLP